MPDPVRNNLVHSCPDCDAADDSLFAGALRALSRREFLYSASAAAVAASTLPSLVAAAEKPSGTPETLVKTLYEALSEQQRKEVCFTWDHQDSKRGLLRTFVANNWNITNKPINSQFYTDDQRDLTKAIFEGIIRPEWHERIYRQLDDDAGGFGEDQSLAIFGKPGDGKFEFVMTGRHMTLRCDGNSTEHVAFGGPIFYGHAADGFNEGPQHKGNVFWYQALAANKLYQMLDGKQQKQALVEKLPREQAVAFRGSEGGLPGIPVTELSSDQKENLQKIMQLLIEPYRKDDQDEAMACLKQRGGLDKCSLAFYQQGDIGKDQVWDCWRLEGPAFVWYFRGAPHVHVWVNIADDPAVKTNS